jgi:hypothetical protein
VAVDSSGWTRFARPDFLLAFSYPDPTPSGQAVDRDEEPFRGNARVHLSSPDRRELYVEVVRFHDLSPQDEYLQHKRHLVERFGAEGVTSLADSRLHEWPALAYGIRWTGDEGSMERSVLLVQLDGETYRVIFDPRSEVNAQVIATMTAAGQSEDGPGWRSRPG